MNPSNPSIHTAQVLPARAVVFLGIIGLHVLFGYLFASGMIATTVNWLRPPPDIQLIPLPDPPPPTDTPREPTATPTMFQANTTPLPDIPLINPEPDAGTITLPPELGTSGTLSAIPEPAPLPIRLVGRNVMPNTAEYYPPAEIRDGHEGTAEIRSCVDVNGRLDGTPTVETTSGRGPLDKAAVRLARDGKYARAMRGDTAVPNCYRFRVTFTLHGGDR